MSDVVLIPTSVIADPKGQFVQGTADFSATAGQVCALDPTSGRYVPASAATEVPSQVKGVACHQAATGQPLRLLVSGLLDVGDSLLTSGLLYTLSATAAGGIAPITDLVSTNFVSVLGQAVDTRTLKLRLWNTEIPLA